MSATRGATPPATVCGVCGTRTRPAFRAPQPEIAPDLDMRPGEPARSTLDQWIRVCRSCGAAAPDLARLSEREAAIVKGSGYETTPLIGPEAALPFLKWAAICRETSNRAAEAEALLQAAWIADDTGDADAACALRRRVAALWAMAPDTETGLRRLDVLRRCGDFDDAERWGAELAGREMDETSRRILDYQRARIAAGDRDRHLISSALPPPAKTPHVTHVQKPAQPGLLSRFFGRR